MSIAVIAVIGLLLIPVVAWANRPYEKYRHAHEEKRRVSLNPAMDEFLREIASGRRPNMLELGPRTILAMFRSWPHPSPDPELEHLRQVAVGRRNLVLIVFLLTTALVFLPQILHQF
jgi:hypothetical protein